MLRYPIQELTILINKATLACSLAQKCERFYDLFVFVYNNNMFLLKKHPQIYHEMEISGMRLFIELNDKSNFIELNDKSNLYVDEIIKKPLKKILLKFHNKYIDNYINTLSSVPGTMPLEIKKNIVSFI